MKDDKVTIRLPMRFDSTAIDRFTKQIVSIDDKPMHRKYDFDFQPLNFIDGCGLTVLSNSMAWLRYHKREIYLYSSKLNSSDAIRYLDDCGFFITHTGRKVFDDSRCRPTTVPCTSIENKKSFQWLEYHLSPWLSDILGINPMAMGSLKASIKEIINNISDHSKMSLGFVHAQFYPKIHRVAVTLSDFGVGIPRTIQNTFGEMRDDSAIELACREGITAQSTRRNMGAGLNFLIDCITSNGGEVLIHSRRGALRCIEDRGQQVRKAQSTVGSYPGTLVEIRLDTRLFRGDDFEDRGEVEW